MLKPKINTEYSGKNLIPDFIIDQYQNNNFNGQLNAATMFIDISSFTAMTQKLMKNGKEGAEVLTDIINRIFTPSIDAIYKNGGFISTFAGDAFTSIFSVENNTILNAIASAVNINTIFEKVGLQKTKFGVFQLTVKIGLSFGNVEWKIIQSEKQNGYYFKGDAINNCAYSEHNCGQGEIIFDHHILTNIEDQEDIEFTEKTENYYSLEKLNKLIPSIEIDLQNQTTENFIPESIIELKTKGEFREIISCFISFTESKDFERHISKVITLSSQFGGYFNKIDFGDKGGVLLVLFGAPSGKEKLFIRACDFALTIRDLHLEGFITSIGLTFGTGFAGFVGSEKRNEYTALGMGVNLSARLMMKADWNEIYIDKFIYPQIKEIFEIDRIPDLKFKGFIAKIPVYKLLKKKGKIQKSSFIGKLVGREQELHELEEFIQPIFGGSPNKQKAIFGGIVFVDGIAGIGKSRLVNELRENLANSVNWFYLPCDEILQKSFNPVIHFFKEYFNQSEENTIVINKANFDSKINSLIVQTKNEEIKNELIRTKSVLGSLINLYWENSLYDQFDAKAKYENTIHAIKNLIKAESLQKPLIIELEDGHNIDYDTKKFLYILTRNVENFPFVIIASCRNNDDGSEYQIGLNDVNENRINVEYLSKEGSNSLIREKMKANVPEKTLELIFDKSEGNPFFIEQMILYLQENKLFDDTLRIKSDEFEIPSNINVVIIARIDRLKTDLKDVIKTASVLGREFAVKILSKMLLGRSIEKHLLEGVKEVIWEALTDIKYVFKHALILEAVYGMQLKKEIRELHKIAAEVIEELFMDEIKIYYSDLANHYEKAEISNKTIDYLEKAGDFAKENYENENAVNFYNRLLQGAKFKISISKRTDILLKKGEIFQLIGRWTEAEQVFEDALKLSQEIDSKKRIAQSIISLGVQFRLKGNYEKAMEYYKKQLIICEELDDKGGISKAIGNMGVVFEKQGNYEKSMECYHKCLLIAEELHDKKGISIAVGNMGIVYLNQGNYEKAMECFQKQIQMKKEINDKRGISIAIGNMGIIYMEQGKYDKSMECYERQLNICEEHGEKSGISRAIGNMGNIYKNLGDHAKMMVCYEKKLNICEELGNKKGISIAIGNMGIVHKDQGNYEKAMDYYEKQLEICEELGDKKGISVVIGNIGSVYEDQGYYQKALECYEKKLQIKEELGDKGGVSIAVENLGNVYLNKGEYNRAITYFDKAIKIDREIGFKSHLLYSLSDKVECLFKKKEYNEADTINRECREIADELRDETKLFKSKVLETKITFQTNNDITQIRNCIEQFEKMLENSKDEEQIASLNFELSIMNFELKRPKNADQHKNEALKLFKKLYDKIPKIDYKNKITELESLNKNN